MTKQEFLSLMNFPSEWDKWEMFPDELFALQLTGYELGQEDAAEHNRFGAFHWWLKKDPTKQELNQLLELSHLDPDQLMAEDVRKYIPRKK